MSKRMRKEEKSEKRIRKTEKERNLGLVVLSLQQMCRWYLGYDGNCDRYRAIMVNRGIPGTQPTTVDVAVLFAQMEYMASTKGHKGL